MSAQIEKINSISPEAYFENLVIKIIDQHISNSIYDRNSSFFEGVSSVIDSQ